MKIVLLNEASGLGKAGDLVEVADGHARNHLIPKGFALRATEGLVRQAENTRKTKKIRESKNLETAKEIAARLGSVAIKISAPVAPEGKLYGAVTIGDIVDVIEKQEKIALDKSSLKISSPIKELGSFPVQVSLHEEVSFELTVEVTAA